MLPTLSGHPFKDSGGLMQCRKLGVKLRRIAAFAERINERHADLAKPSGQSFTSLRVSVSLGFFDVIAPTAAIIFKIWRSC